MKEHKFQFSYKVYKDINELAEADMALLQQARKATTSLLSFLQGTQRIKMHKDDY